MSDRTLGQEDVNQAYQEHREQRDEQIGEYQYVFFGVGQHKWKMMWFVTRTDRRCCFQSVMDCKYNSKILKNLQLFIS